MAVLGSEIKQLSKNVNLNLALYMYNIHHWKEKTVENMSA